MRFNFLSLALLPAALSNPLPTPQGDGIVVVPITPRGQPHVYRCDDAGWKGHCFLETNPTACHNWQGTFGGGSFGPDRGLECRVWGFPNCEGPESAAIAFPGTGDNLAWAGEHGFGFNSWKCKYT